MDGSVIDFNVRLRTITTSDLAIGMIVTVILSSILTGIFPAIEESDDLFLIVVLLIAVLLFVFALRGTKGLDRNFENLFESDVKKEIIYVLVLNLIFAFLFTFLISLLDILIGFGDPTWISIWDVDTINIDSSVLVLDSIVAIIFAPIIEELVFRGILFNRLKIKTGIIPAMIISSFIFAIGHDFGGITSAFIFGICMCTLYLKTDNILIPMSIHFLNNLLATIIDLIGIDAVMAQLPWIIPSLIITIIGSFYLVKYVIKETRALKKMYG